MDRLQRPPDRLDVVGVERPVGVVEVDPEADPLGQPVPVLDVAEHLLAAARVELRDPVALDVLLGGDAELRLDRQLDRQAVTVPAALALDVEAAHRLVARKDVLEHARQHVVGAGRAVGGRRPLVEAPRRSALRGGAPTRRTRRARASARAPAARGRGTTRADRPGGEGRHGRGILGGTPARARSAASSAGQREPRAVASATGVGAQAVDRGDRAARAAGCRRRRDSHRAGTTVLAPVSGTAPR